MVELTEENPEEVQTEEGPIEKVIEESEDTDRGLDWDDGHRGADGNFCVSVIKTYIKVLYEYTNLVNNKRMLI